MDAAEKRLSYADYLQLEAETGIKHEYYDGAAVAMSGGSYDHARITTNTVVALSGQVRAPSEVFTSELRVQEGAWQLVDLEASGRIELGEHGSIALSDLYRATDLARSESRSDG